MTEMVNKDSDRNGGFALFAVLSFMLIAAAVATPFLTGARTRALIARNVASELKDRMVVRGLISIAAMRFIERARVSGSSLPRRVTCDFDEGSVDFVFQDHNGLIDLNVASAELLVLGFQALGRSEADAVLLAEAVVAFRAVSPDRAATRTVSVQGGDKHLQFESVYELEDFKDPGERGFRDAASIFTVYNGTGTIHADDAPVALKTLISALPSSNSFFVVQGNSASTTASVQAVVRRGGKPSVNGVAVVRSMETKNGMTFFSPIRSTRGEDNLDLVSTAISCSEFFGTQLAPVVAELASG